ncbi:MAG: heme-binding domain-containing protein [Deltaproteobacteria bacterium]|nr:heme-binding domain-containing protein [Deltaproteobacteria bacterium]
MKILALLGGLLFFMMPFKLSLANQLYRQNVRPIFETKCFDCHSDQTRYPWYYRLPGVRQLMDHDIEEAREHIDLSHDFPFGGHHPLKEQLKDLKEVVEENEMPLWRYRLLHWNSGLTDEERRIILEWLEKSQF